MSAIENLAQQEFEPLPALQPQVQLDGMETIFNSLTREAKNDVQVLGDQLTATNVCAKHLRREWRAFIDRGVMNGFEYLQRLARAQTPADMVELQRNFAQIQIGAMRDYWDQCGRLAAAGAVACACEK